MGKSGEPTCPTWMVTLGDCMSLLVTFFVLLLTFSTIKEDQLMELLGVINGALNTVDDMRMSEGRRERPLEGEEQMHDETNSQGRWADNRVATDEVAPVELKNSVVQQRYNLMRERLQSLGFGKNLTLVELEEGLAVSVHVQSMFAEDGATLRPDAYAVLAAFADLALEVTNEVRISIVDAGGAPGQAATQTRQPLIVAGVLAERFQVEQARLSYGLKRGAPGTPPSVELLLVDAIHVHTVSMRDVIRDNTTVW